MVKVLFLKLIIFFLLLFVPLYFLQKYVDNGLLKMRLGEYGVWNDIYESKINADVVIVGSSRATVNISSPILTEKLKLNTYNIGIDGGDFNMEYLRFQVYLQHNKKPKVVILSLHTADLQKNEGIFNQEQFLPFLGDTLVRNATSGYSSSLSYADYYIPAVKYRSDFQSVSDGIKMVLDKPVSRIYYAMRTNGYEARDRKWDDSFDKLKRSGKKFDIKFNDELVAKFQEFIKYCKEKNIELIFVYTPEYTGVQPYFVNREMVMNYYGKVAKDNSIPMLDYSQDSISSNTAYFYNSEHLNTSGSVYFTMKLASDLVNLGIK